MASVAVLAGGVVSAGLGVSPASASARKSPYYIAGMASLTGAADSSGIASKAGMTFELHQVDAAGGVNGHPVKLTKVENDGTTPALGVSEIRGIIANTRNLALLGPSASTVATAVVSLAQRGGLPLIAPVGATLFTSPLKSYAFRAFMRNSIVANGMLKFIARKGAKTVAVIYPSNAFGTSGSNAYKSLAHKYGVKVVADVAYPTTATNMTTQILEAKAVSPQSYIVWSGTSTLVPVLIGMHEQGIRSSKTPIVTTIELTTSAHLKAVGSGAEGVYLDSQMTASHPHPGLQSKFVKAWAKAHGGTLPTSSDADGYLQAELVVKGMKNVLAKHLRMTRSNLRRGIQEIKNLKTVYGLISYSATNHDGISIKNVQINVVKNGVARPVVS